MTLSTQTFCQAICLLILGLFACNDPATTVVPDNNAPSYDKISTIQIENYVNRMYIDLLGREPLDAEMDQDVDLLKAGGLSAESRNTLTQTLQANADFVEGDSSYRFAYYRWFYEYSKARMLEGVADGEIYRQIALLNTDILRDTLMGDWVSYQKHLDRRDKLDAVLNSHRDYRDGKITVKEVFSRMLTNQVYDEINMNSINFIRACFDDLFFRLHTQAEFEQSFPIIEFNISGSIFGQPASNKEEYVRVLIDSREFHEGMIRWAYTSLLARDPNSAEVEAAMKDFFTTLDFQKVQRDILITDEYAGF